MYTAISSVMSGEGDRLRGYYRDIKMPAYFRVEEDGVSWHEGGRETKTNLRIEHGVFQPAGEIMREVTGIQNYNFKLTINRKGSGDSQENVSIKLANREILFILIFNMNLLIVKMMIISSGSSATTGLRCIS